MTLDPHGTQPIVAAGTPLTDAPGAIILLHGRGGSTRDILDLGTEIAPGWTLLAPAAAGQTWYPYTFLAPREQNEPFLSSALGRVHAALDAAFAAGIPAEKIVICGFSQGACLATEFVGRNPQRYGALVAFTGGLIGPIDVPITLAGDLAGMPVLLSSGDPDPHVPWLRVQQSGELLQQIGGRVTLRRHPGRPHTIGVDEISIASQMIAAI